jgi:chromosome segregation ATPase
MAEQPDLNFLARQNERILAELAAMRDEQRVQMQEMQADFAALKEKINAWPDLHLLQEAAQRQQRDTASVRDDIRVLTAIAMRLDSSHSILLDELRATHAQIARMNDRLRTLEDTAPPL